ncbi:MAG: ABC transporter substrate-binding protein [Solirubrobacterales bacterium]
MGGLLAVALLTALATGCGDSSSSSSDSSATIIRGTTDQPISYDPAGAYDLPSYDGIYAMYQNLLTVEPGGNEAVPEAAESCDFTDKTSQTFECTLKDGLTFSDDSPLTAEDVVFSFERNVDIADPNGASSLLANMTSLEASADDKTVTFDLKAPDATWPLVLTTASFAIVPSDVYPADKLQPSEDVVGSGRYTLADYQPGQQTVMEKSDAYQGDSPAKNERVIIQYFDKASPLKLAVEQGDVDIAYRSLSPTDLSDLDGSDGLSVVSGNGTEIRYLTFNLDLQPGDNDEQKKAIRQAVAQTVDRQAIADNVYDGTVQPLYSMVPQGLQYATKAFADRYGEVPDLDRATQTLEDAGVDTPVPLEIWWTPSHYGTSSGDEYAEIKRQLDESGLFDVTLKSTEWNQYSTAAFTDKYPTYQLGWFLDYPDADDYTASFYSPDSFLNIHYDNPDMNKLLAEEKGSDETSVRETAFQRIDEIGAEDAPTIPIWQADQVAAVRDGVEGVEETFDPSFIFRFWLISKS